jgi:hypothetical protein
VGALVVTTQFVNAHPNLRFCLRLEGREVVHRPIVQRGKVVLVEEGDTKCVQLPPQRPPLTYVVPPLRPSTLFYSIQHQPSTAIAAFKSSKPIPSNSQANPCTVHQAFFSACTIFDPVELSKKQKYNQPPQNMTG